MSVAAFDMLKTSRDLAEAGFQVHQAEAIATALRDAVSESAVTKSDMARQENRIVSLDERLEGIATKEDLARVEARLKSVMTKADLARAEKRPEALLTNADLYWGLSIQAVAIVAAVAALNMLQ